jgi:hypothetical protein
MSKDLSTGSEAAHEGTHPAEVTSTGGAGLESALDAGAGRDAKRRKKQRARVRGAWISFVGRIVAQFVGSAASIVLGLMLIERHHAAVTATQAAAVPAAAVAPAQVLPGPTLLVVPLQNVPRDQQQLLVDQLAAAIKVAVGENASVAVVPRVPEIAADSNEGTRPGNARRRASPVKVESSVASTGPGTAALHR